METNTAAITSLPLGAALEIYTDGSCLGNPGPMGWGLVIVHEGAVIYRDQRSLGHGTNNIAELSAAVEAATLLQERPDLIVTIISDSEYVIKNIKERVQSWKARGWRTTDKKPVKNRPLWETLDKLAQSLPNIVWQWVRGHDGNSFNEMADVLASAAANR